jgi:hypothetical protein
LVFQKFLVFKTLDPDLDPCRIWIKFLNLVLTFVGNFSFLPKHCSILDLDEEDDGELRPVRKAPAIIKPPPNNTRLPANMENPRPNNNRPRIGGAPLWSAMAPPSTPNSHKVQGRGLEKTRFF